MKKQFLFTVGAVFFSLSSRAAKAGELNFAGLFDSFGGNKISQQREIEQRIENDINNFRSIKSSRVIIPVEDAKNENIWGLSEARVLPVEVILKLKKRRRLTQNEFTSISNLLSSSLSNKNQMVQPVIRDEEGFEWTDETSESKGYFKATALEHEIWDRLKNVKDVDWASVHVSPSDSSCKIFGSFNAKEDHPDIQVRRNVMTTLGDLCTSARLSIAAPKTESAKAGSADSVLLLLERGAYILLGFALWGLYTAFRKHKKVARADTPVTDTEDAIILTQIVDRSPDQAAKWMVRALMSEPASSSEENKKPQIFDQSL